MRRRVFLSLVTGAAVLQPPPGAAQQKAIPVIGFVGSSSASSNVHLVQAFTEGLRECGLIDGQNVAIEYRWADNQYDRLPNLLADVIGRQVAVILAGGGPATILAAKLATSAIPIVFPAMSNPVELGLVASLARPGGNVTGIAALTIELDAKRLELLRDLVPSANRVGVLVNPNRPGTEKQVADIEAAGRALGRQLVIAPVGSDRDFDAGFAMLKQRDAGALLVSA